MVAWQVFSFFLLGCSVFFIFFVKMSTSLSWIRPHGSWRQTKLYFNGFVSSCVIRKRTAHLGWNMNKVVWWIFFLTFPVCKKKHTQWRHNCRPTAKTCLICKWFLWSKYEIYHIVDGTQEEGHIESVNYRREYFECYHKRAKEFSKLVWY